jgi:hypothetical protein
MITKEYIVNLLETNDKAVGRALIVLKNRQTHSEQVTKTTHVTNNRGFTQAHGRSGTGMAQFYERAGFLTARQLAFWRRKNKNGVMRIGMYWRQLIEEAEAKKAA